MNRPKQQTMVPRYLVHHQWKAGKKELRRQQHLIKNSLTSSSFFFYFFVASCLALSHYSDETDVESDRTQVSDRFYLTLRASNQIIFQNSKSQS